MSSPSPGADPSARPPGPRGPRSPRSPVPSGADDDAFGGALIVIQPSFEIFGWTSLLPVACAFLYTLYLFLNRAIGDADWSGAEAKAVLTALMN